MQKLPTVQMLQSPSQLRQPRENLLFRNVRSEKAITGWGAAAVLQLPLQTHSEALLPEITVATAHDQAQEVF